MTAPVGRLTPAGVAVWYRPDRPHPTTLHTPDRLTQPPEGEPMPHLTLVIPQSPPGDWWGRLDVAEALEAAGWTGDDDGHLLGKNGAFWGVTNQADDSSLTCPNDTTIDFPSETPAVVIVAACLAAAAEQPSLSEEELTAGQADADALAAEFPNEEQLCDSEFPGDDSFVGQLCERPLGHGGDHWCMAEIAGTKHRRQLAWPAARLAR